MTKNTKIALGIGAAIVGILVLATLAFVVLLALFGGATEESTDTSPPSAAGEPFEDTYTTDEGVRDLKDTYFWFHDVPKQLLVDTAESICTQMDQGASVDTVLNDMWDIGMPAEESGAFFAFSVMTTCPEYTGDMERWMAEH